MNSNVTGTDTPVRASVSVVVISVENLAASLRFYADTLGLEVAETLILKGSEFESYWQVPAGTTARCAFLKHGPDTVGCVQLMEFAAPNRKLIRQPGIKRAIGLFNLNIYTKDVKRLLQTRQLFLALIVELAAEHRIALSTPVMVNGRPRLIRWPAYI